MNKTSRETAQNTLFSSCIYLYILLSFLNISIVLKLHFHWFLLHRSPSVILGDPTSTGSIKFISCQQHPFTGRWMGPRDNVVYVVKRISLVPANNEPRFFGCPRSSLSTIFNWVIFIHFQIIPDRLCGLVVRVPGYRFDSRR
jgi:hypothetical protein